jgi:hypothetical protein
MNKTTAGPAGFDSLELKPFASLMGLVLHAPKTWIDTGDPQNFQVQEPDTATVITASGYENQGLTLERWAQLRLQAVEQGMPYLRVYQQPYRVQGTGWNGIAAEYEGVFPSSPDTKRYLVLCLCTDKMILSITVTALLGAFKQREPFYRWLLEKKLELYKVERL